MLRGGPRIQSLENLNDTASVINMALSKCVAQSVVPTCDVHQDEELDIYCHTCKKSICLECIKKEHANHDYEKFSKIARKFLKEIPTKIQGNTQKILSEHRREINILKTSQELIRDKVEHAIYRISHHRNTIHMFVDSMADELITAFEEKAKHREQETENCIRKHTEAVQEIEELLTYIQESSLTLSSGTLFQLKSDFEKKLEQSSKIDNYSSQHGDELFYVEGEIIEDQLRSMVGRLIRNDPSKVVMSERTNFTVGDMSIYTVVPVSHDSVWIRSIDLQNIELVDINGSVKDKRELDFSVLNFDIDRDGDIFFSPAEKIQKLDKNGSITTVRKTSPLQPVGVSLTKEGDLLVSLIEEWDFEPKDDGRRIVQRIKTSGEVVTTYEFDIDGSTRLFTIPYRVQQNYNGDICVVDATGNTNGRLCVLGFDGVIKFIYNGQNLKNKFGPSDVVCDCTSNIIINDIQNHAIHILGPTGEFQKYFRDDLTERSVAIGLYQSVLWLGGNKGVIKVFNYKYN